MLEELKAIQPGVVLYYRIKKEGIDPRRVWTGRVTSNLTKSEVSLPGFYVETLDEGIEGNREWVGVEQIVSYSTHGLRLV